mmetsp:Transcript_118862/g.296487  ORF Transcript_118862/g.296487 Transcript_118862/m.296487 type:complete len:110 (-) Transcript_118862:1041-1370(-)
MRVQIATVPGGPHLTIMADQFVIPRTTEMRMSDRPEFHSVVPMSSETKRRLREAAPSQDTSSNDFEGLLEKSRGGYDDLSDWPVAVDAAAARADTATREDAEDKCGGCR